MFFTTGLLPRVIKSTTKSASVRLFNSSVVKPSASAFRSLLDTSPFQRSSLKSPIELLKARSNAKRSITTSITNTTRQEPIDWKKLATSALIAGAGVIGVNYALNREVRGALSPGESSYLHETFMWTGAGLAITGGLAKYLHSSGTAARLMSLNPFVFMGVGLVASIGSMFAVFATAPDTPAHYAAWAVFSALQGVTLSPMYFLAPAILGRAALLTAGALVPLVYVGTTAENSTFLYLGGALLAGLGVVIVAGIAPMFLPRMGARTLSTLEHLSAYGGVAIFSGLILYDTQKILNHARLAEEGRLQRDPVRESVSLILDVINLFVKMVQVLLLQQRKK